MSITRSTVDTIQTDRVLPLTIAADNGNENKEEKSDSVILMNKTKKEDLNKQLWASHLAAFNAFLIAISSNKSLTIPTFLFLGKIQSEIFLGIILPFLASETDLQSYCSLTSVRQGHWPIKMFFQGHAANVYLKKLLQHIAYGEKEQAEKIIQSNPKLLLLSGPIVEDYSGRKIQQFAYQMALAAGDVLVKFENDEYQPEAQGEEMKEMIERYFIKLLGEHDGVAAYKQQAQMISPGNLDEYWKQKSEAHFAALTELFDALANAQATDQANLLDECGEALKKFKTYLEPKGIITTTTPGYHFDPQLLIMAYSEFEANFPWEDEDQDASKFQFLWENSIGLILRYLTASDAMVLCQEPYHVVKGEEFKRSLNFREGGGVYYPRTSDTAWSLPQYSGFSVPILLKMPFTLSKGGYSTSCALPYWASYIMIKQLKCESVWKVQPLIPRLSLSLG